MKPEELYVTLDSGVQLRRQGTSNMEAKKFKPTDLMYRTKSILHRACPPQRAVMLTPNEPNIHNLIRPTSLAQLYKWLETYGEEFWEWFITPPAVDGNELEARDKAYAALMEIFDLPGITEEGNANYANMKIKLEAAKLLLAQKNPLVAIQNNVNEEGTPRGLRGKTTSQIEDRLHQLTKHMPRQELRGSNTVEAELE